MYRYGQCADGSGRWLQSVTYGQGTNGIDGALTKARAKIVDSRLKEKGSWQVKETSGLASCSPIRWRHMGLVLHTTTTAVSMAWQYGSSNSGGQLQCKGRAANGTKANQDALTRARARAKAATRM